MKNRKRLGRWRQEDPKFQVFLVHTVRSRPAWDPRILKTNEQINKKNAEETASSELLPQMLLHTRTNEQTLARNVTLQFTSVLFSKGHGLKTWFSAWSHWEMQHGEE